MGGGGGQGSTVGAARRRRHAFWHRAVTVHGRVWWVPPGTGTLLPRWLVPIRVTARGTDAPASRHGAAGPAAAPVILGMPEQAWGARHGMASGSGVLRQTLTSPLLSPADPFPEPRRGLAGLHLGASPRRQMPLHGRHPRPGHLFPRPAQPPAPPAHGEGEPWPTRR